MVAFLRRSHFVFANRMKQSHTLAISMDAKRANSSMLYEARLENWLITWCTWIIYSSKALNSCDWFSLPRPPLRADYPSALSISFPPHKAFILQVLEPLSGAWGHLTCAGRWQMRCLVAPQERGSSGISRRAQWEDKHFRELWNVYAKLKERTEGDRSVNGIVLYITFFCRIRLIKYSVNMKKWQSALPNSFMSLCI